MREEILRLVYAAIDEVNAQTVTGVPLEKSLETSLLGGDEGMDSLTFVNLIVAMEEQIQSTLGKSVVLVNEDSMSLQEQPFRTIGTLASYVQTLVDSQPD